MVTVRVHPLGIGESLGDDLIINGPLVHTGQVWWVDAATGDASGGLERSRPFATLAQAYAAASDGDIIVLMDGHTETISTAAPVTIAKKLTIVGSGQSAGKPTVKLAFTGSAAVPITVSAANVELRNIWFEAQGTANANVKIDVTADHFVMRNCYMECGANDDNYGLRLDSSDHSVIRGCTFISTATSRTATPVAALNFDDAQGLSVEDCIFDGGTVGWSGGYAIDCDDTADSFDLRMEDVTCLRGSDIRVQLHTTGYIMVNAGSYAPRIDWDGAEALA